jgi:hypothetical protein
MAVVIIADGDAVLIALCEQVTLLAQVLAKRLSQRNPK